VAEIPQHERERGTKNISLTSGTSQTTEEAKIYGDKILKKIIIKKKGT
jgi:hypothetical protein